VGTAEGVWGSGRLISIERANFIHIWVEQWTLIVELNPKAKSPYMND